MIEIGKSGNAKIGFDLERLLETRLLIQATSGAGKSWVLRRLLEQSHGKVQQIVIDLEGEFLSLREKFDYILAGKGGDTACDHRVAKILAARLMEHRASAIIDLYELKKHEREWFVKAFLEALIGLPARLWNPCLVVMDEAHHFCPQTTKSESVSAVIDLITRGRKRGLCPILTTQRISKLHKDAAAELLNKLCGNTTLDVDQRRAADELGIATREDRLALRQIPTGHFYALGPALRGGTPNDFGVVDVEIGPVQTTHDRRLLKARDYQPPEPTEKVRKLLAEFKDLPAAAMQEEEVVKRLQKELSEARRELTQAQKQAPTKEIVKVKPCDHPAIIKRLEEELRIDRINLKRIESAHRKIERAVAESPLTGSKIEVKSFSKSEVFEMKKRLEVHRPVIVKEVPPVSVYSQNGLPGYQKKILNALATLRGLGIDPAKREAVAGLAGYAPNGGAFGNYLGQLRSRGLIDYPQQGLLSLTEEGIGAASADVNVQSVQDIHRIWLELLPGYMGRILESVIEAYPEPVSKEDLAAASGYAASGGAFGNYLGRLRSYGVIDYPRQGFVRATNVLFPPEVFE